MEGHALLQTTIAVVEKITLYVGGSEIRGSMKKQVCVWLLLVVVSAGTANLLSYTDLDSSPDQSPPVIWSLCSKGQ